MPIAFATPFLLTALVLLPVIWWLLRLTPPKPRDVQFPPTRLLLEIIKPDETPAHSPWWLTAIRLALAAAVILALAGPLWQPDENRAPLAGNALLIIDNGFASAPDWTARMEAAGRLINDAGENDYLIALMPAIPVAGQILASPTLLPKLLSPAEARSLLQTFEPQALTINRSQIAANVRAFMASPDGRQIAQIVWFSNNLSTAVQNDPDGRADQALIAAINDGDVPVILLRDNKNLLALNPPVNGLA